MQIKFGSILFLNRCSERQVEVDPLTTSDRCWIEHSARHTKIGKMLNQMQNSTSPQPVIWTASSTRPLTTEALYKWLIGMQLIGDFEALQPRELIAICTSTRWIIS